MGWEEVGYTAKELRDGGVGFSVAELLGAGYTAPELRGGGYTTSELRAKGARWGPKRDGWWAA